MEALWPHFRRKNGPIWGPWSNTLSTPNLGSLEYHTLHPRVFLDLEGLDATKCVTSKGRAKQDFEAGCPPLLAMAPGTNYVWRPEPVRDIKHNERLYFFVWDWQLLDFADAPVVRPFSVC